MHTVASSPVSMKYNPGAKVVIYTINGMINGSNREINSVFFRFQINYLFNLCSMYKHLFSIKINPFSSASFLAPS